MNLFKKLQKNVVSKILLIIFFILTFLPNISHAHVKWFAESIVEVEPYKITDIFVITSIALVILAVFIGIFLEKKISVPTRFNKFIEKFAPIALSIASIGFGTAFLLFSYYGFIFAPNLPAVGSIGNILLIIQLIAGLMILLGFYERIGGFLIILLFLLGIKEYGAVEMLDTLEMLGFAFYVMIIGRPKWKIIETHLFQNLSHKIHEYGLPILRVGTGLNLIVLGFTEKILNPSLTQNFLTQYNWNFVEIFGFSDYYFAFSAGAVEVLFGLFFLLGLITRISTVLLAGFLVTTLILLGPIELIGHLPHFSIAIVLLILGSGSRLKLINK
jgi:uncharacterized membrane protein YphA (DoxX/SURF4 family)